MQQFSKVAKCGAWSTITIAKNSTSSQKPDNMQKFTEDKDGDVIMINEKGLRGIQCMIIVDIDEDVVMEEIPEYPEDVIMEDLDEGVVKEKAKRLLDNEGQETRDGKMTGKKKGKKSKNKLNKSC